MSLTHATIDDRLLRLVAQCATKIDADPSLLQRVRAAIERQPDERVRAEWTALLAEPWPVLRAKLLESSDRGQALRQNAPFGGLLTVRERMAIFRAAT